MNSDDQDQKLIYSYLALRQTVGWIGILLPLVLMGGMSIVFGKDRILGSISQYYHSPMRDVLVGALCSIALFLFFYRGYKDTWKKINWDAVITSFCGILAVGMALFPTSEKGLTDLNCSMKVHAICASLFFLVLACYSFFVFTRTKGGRTKQKKIRNRIYRACGIIMFACLLSIGIYALISIKTGCSIPCMLFWLETFALVAFGFSWLTKGGAIYSDKEEEISTTACYTQPCD